MKSKLFTLFAAFVLLFSAQASAQTNGDVNGDGKVDEQDIAAILEIMAEAGGVKEKTKHYWYAGQTAPTASNYTTLATQVTNYSPTIEYTTTTRNYVYFLIADNKSITKVMNGALTANVSETTSPIAGYKLYKSNAGIASGITLTIYIE